MSITVKKEDAFNHIITIDGEDIQCTKYEKKILELLERIANK